MTIRELIDSEGLENICAMAGWQGGTIHQAEVWVKAKLKKHGVFTHKDTGELITITIGGAIELKYQLTQ